MKLLKKSFLAWLAKQPGDRRFNYTSNEDCLIASWIKETNEITEADDLSVIPGGVRLGPAPARDLLEFPKWLCRVDDLASNLTTTPENDRRSCYIFSVEEFRKVYQS